MATEISLFSQKDFIKAAKDFVCVRLGTYESEEHQKIVRSLLNGSFQNTAFVVYAPDGKTKLTRSGRSPQHAFGRNVIEGMEDITKEYKSKGSQKDATLQDFHSFKQSLNVASADQRLLVLTSAPNNKKQAAEKIIQQVFSYKEIAGRFHFDTLSSGDSEWPSALKGGSSEHGFVIVQSGEFGMTGKVVKQLPLDSSAASIKDALLKLNKAFAESEKRKNYSSHVKEGRQKGVNFENTMPPGEDRDGDGVIDKKNHRR